MYRRPDEHRGGIDTAHSRHSFTKDLLFALLPGMDQAGGGEFAEIKKVLDRIVPGAGVSDDHQCQFGSDSRKVSGTAGNNCLSSLRAQ